MTSDPPARTGSRYSRLARGERLSRFEFIGALVFIVGLIVVDVVGLIASGGAAAVDTLFSIATTLVFLLFLRWPGWGSAALAALFALSFLLGLQAQVLVGAAIAVGLILRLGWTALVLAYAAGFLVASAIVAFVEPPGGVNLGLYLILAAVAGVLGFALRAAGARGRRLEEELAAQEEREHQAVLAERRWIAGELHDSIAHHLTVVALHAQMLDDESTRPASQEVIRGATKKAMADLRFVIDLADDGPRATGDPAGDLASAIAEAGEEFAAAGHAVRTDGDPRDERLPRIADIVLGRIMRESATNVLKYAGSGEVSILLDVDDDHARLRVRSPLPDATRPEISSGRTGLRRMAERVLGASGAFEAGPDDGHWVVSARLPIT